MVSYSITFNVESGEKFPESMVFTAADGSRKHYISTEAASSRSLKAAQDAYALATERATVSDRLDVHESEGPPPLDECPNLYMSNAQVIQVRVLDAGWVNVHAGSPPCDGTARLDARESETPNPKETQMIRTTRDIIVPAGTELFEPPAHSTRWGKDLEAVIGIDRDHTVYLSIDPEDGFSTGLLEASEGT